MITLSQLTIFHGAQMNNDGIMIIFDANLIHVGTLLDSDNNIRIQMKVTHKDDIEVLSYYQNFNKNCRFNLFLFKNKCFK